MFQAERNALAHMLTYPPESLDPETDFKVRKSFILIIDVSA